ncbi:unnamed protein product [Calypogeia fissa]
MAVQKSSGGGRSIARGQKFIIWVIFGVICLVFFQFWTYEKTWATDHSNIHGSKKALREMLMKSLFSPEDDHGGLDDNPDFRLLRELFTVCNSSFGYDGIEEASSKTLSGDCLLKLQQNFPSLQPSNLPSLGGQHESCQNKVDEEESIGALQKQVDKLSDLLRKSTVLMELRDTRESGLTDKDTTWFMSSIHGSQSSSGFPEEFEFPSELSDGRLLCLMGNNESDGSQNKYGFAWKEFLPPGATLLPGLTLVADNYWDYNNIWHAMSALTGFVSWGARNGCLVPQRVLLYHWGEHLTSMGSWIDNVLHASFGRKLEVEQLESNGIEEPFVCLERAIVNRRGLGRMSDETMNSMFDTIRCRSRKYCGLEVPEATKSQPTSVTLFLRTGARAFRNPSDVSRIIDEVCEEVGNCHVEVAYASNLSFCEQVGLMSRTDVLVTTHGAQMTNMMFMSKGASVMELIPKGWLEFAGIGQYIYTWLASWANLHYEGVWRDPEGPDCPYPPSETLPCLLFHKDLEVGHNATHLAEWTRDVLRNFRERRESKTVAPSNSLHCTCERDDDTLV